MERATIQVYIVTLAVLAALPARATTVTWLPTSGTNDWFVETNWSGGTWPTNADDVRITNANVGVLLTNSSAALASILLSNKCVLIFSNWDTSLSATNVTIQTNAVMTLPAAFSNNMMSNRVWVVCSNLTLAPGASINVTGRGYSSPTNVVNGYGPGGGQGKIGDYASGAGHGGRGGMAYLASGTRGGPTYGALAQPDAPGSAGGSGGASYAGGGAGGGAVRIQADGQVTVNGSITANGNAGPGLTGGGGSGGSVWISCNTFAGTNGLMEVKGGNGNTTTVDGGGGGGRIAVIYNTTNQAALLRPTVQFFATPGKGAVSSLNRQDADLGTLYFPDNQLFDSTWLPHIGRWLAPNFTNLTVTNLVVSNGYLRLPGEGFRLNVTNNLTIIGTNSFTSATLDIGGDNYATNANSSNMWHRQGLTSGPRLSISGNLVLTNGGRLSVHSGQTNGGGASYGAEVIVGGIMQVVSNAWVYPFSHPTNGGSVLFQIGSNLFISSNAGFNADGLGFAGGSGQSLLGSGPGGGKGVFNAYSGGGGYGGAGGTSTPSYPGGYGGISYGSSNAPAHAGSGGGADGQLSIGWGGHGGGFVNILARSGSVTFNGTITANGLNSGTWGGGGAGGGVMVECQSLAGNGSLTANGGAAVSPTLCGGGGGGRIAVWYGNASDLLRQQIIVSNMTHVASELAPQTFTGSATANGGDGYGDGTNGTVRFLQLYFPAGTIFTVH